VKVTTARTHVCAETWSAAAKIDGPMLTPVSFIGWTSM
jgi:hypothetical protein